VLEVVDGVAQASGIGIVIAWMVVHPWPPTGTGQGMEGVDPSYGVYDDEVATGSREWYRTALTKLARALPEPARHDLLASFDDIETLSSEGRRTLVQLGRAWFAG
jgi:hypothetical protein